MTTNTGTITYDANTLAGIDHITLTVMQNGAAVGTPFKVGPTSASFPLDLPAGTGYTVVGQSWTDAAETAPFGSPITSNEFAAVAQVPVMVAISVK